MYVTANALSSQSIYSLSNFYLNLAKYLNKDFHSYNTLLAENFYKVNNFDKAKKIFNGISKEGEGFKWYSSKQLAKIYILEGNNDLAFKLMKNAYKTLKKKIYMKLLIMLNFLKIMKNLKSQFFSIPKF